MKIFGMKNYISDSEGLAGICSELPSNALSGEGMRHTAGYAVTQL